MNCSSPCIQIRLDVTLLEFSSYSQVVKVSFQGPGDCGDCALYDMRYKPLPLDQCLSAYEALNLSS
jgi:hypothetical protein